MDDPCPIDQRTNETATVFKNVVGSSGPCQVEIKFGAMQFDSHLIIITTNTPPDIMAHSFGVASEEAMYRRFTDPPGEMYVKERLDAETAKHRILKVIQKIA